MLILPATVRDGSLSKVDVNVFNTKSNEEIHSKMQLLGGLGDT